MKREFPRAISAWFAHIIHQTTCIFPHESSYVLGLPCRCVVYELQLQVTFNTPEWGQHYKYVKTGSEIIFHITRQMCYYLYSTYFHDSNKPRIIFLGHILRENWAPLAECILPVFTKDRTGQDRRTSTHRRQFMRRRSQQASPASGGGHYLWKGGRSQF